MERIHIQPCVMHINIAGIPVMDNLTESQASSAEGIGSA